MNGLVGSFPVGKDIQRCMYMVLVKKSIGRYFALIIIFTFLFWIFLTSDFNDQQIVFNKRCLTPGYDFANKDTANYLVQTNKSRRESHISRRQWRRRDHFHGPEIGSRDFHPKHYRVMSPMQKILKLSGQNFQQYVDDPDFKEMHNFQQYSTPQYLKDFKNPCFYKNESFGRHEKNPGIARLRCVPYFMIAGFPKCATTDLWYTLTKHPEVSSFNPKEVNFFNKKQFAHVPIESAVDYYQGMFTGSVMTIEKSVSKTGFHHCVIGDASVDTIFDNKLWRKLPGNELLTEPLLTNANYVHSINPNMKVIVLLRNPVERLYSDYIYMSSSVGYTTSPEDFHNTVVENIANYTACLRQRTQRACAYDMYDDWNIRTYKVRLKVGMYYIFLSDWLKVFPRDNVMVVKCEDTRGPNRTLTVIKIFKFLGLGMFSRKEVEEIYRSQNKNERRRNSELMLSKTRTILSDFYKHFNKELETLIPHIRY